MALTPEALSRLNLTTCPLCGDATQKLNRMERRRFERQGIESVVRCVSPACPWWAGIVHGLFVERKVSDRDQRTLDVAQAHGIGVTFD